MKLLVVIIGLFFSLSPHAQNVERYITYHDHGRMLILEGKYKEAIPYLDTAINIMPYYPAIFLDRGYAYMQIKDYGNAIKNFNHVLDKKPYMTDARLQRGMALYHLGKLDKSEQDLLQVARANPSKSKEITIYLDNIRQERENSLVKNQEYITNLRNRAENERLHRARYREEVIWNTVVPLAFWTTVFLTW